MQTRHYPTRYTCGGCVFTKRAMLFVLRTCWGWRASNVNARQRTPDVKCIKRTCFGLVPSHKDRRDGSLSLRFMGFLPDATGRGV